MKTLLLLLSLFTGCATIGEYNYSGKSNKLIINEYVIRMPEAPRGIVIHSGSSFDYWNAGVNKIVEVSNGSNELKTATIHCDCVQFPDDVSMDIPPHKTKTMLIRTTATYAYDKLCSLR